jgi:hypothetical protein
MHSEISLGFMSFFNRFSNTLNSSRQLIKRGLDAFKTGCDTAEKFIRDLGFGNAHGFCVI